MIIYEQIEQDFKQAYLNKEESVVSVLRMLKAVLKNAQIQKIAELTDEDVIKVLKSEVKKRKESALEYQQGNRQDLADKETEEVKIIEKYLPEQISEDKIRLVVKEVIGQNQGMNNGKLIGAVMSQLKGQADGNVVKKIVEEELASN